MEVSRNLAKCEASDRTRSGIPTKSKAKVFTKGSVPEEQAKRRG